MVVDTGNILLAGSCLFGGDENMQASGEVHVTVQFGGSSATITGPHDLVPRVSFTKNDDLLQ